MSENRDTIVVVHGFGGKRIWMVPLVARLRKSYRVINWGYNSFYGSIARHADRLAETLLDQSRASRIHIVAHSMGSIVVRAAIENDSVDNLGRIVLLAPPNQGTPIARLASPVLGAICKPISELSSSSDSFVNSLSPSIGYSTGIVAGKYDVLVTPRYTNLANVDDYVVTSATHNSLLLSKTTATLAMQFLETGRFQTSS